MLSRKWSDYPGHKSGLTQHRPACVNLIAHGRGELRFVAKHVCRSRRFRRLLRPVRLDIFAIRLIPHHLGSKPVARCDSALLRSNSGLPLYAPYSLRAVEFPHFLNSKGCATVEKCNELNYEAD
jgi:hypothetical protein